MPPIPNVLPFGQLSVTSDIVPPDDLDHEQARIAAAHDLSLATGIPLDLYIHVFMWDPMWVFEERQPNDGPGIAGGVIPTVAIDFTDLPATLARLAVAYPPIPPPAPPPPPFSNPLGIDLNIVRAQDPASGALIPAAPPQGKEVFLCNPSGYVVPNGEPVTLAGVIYVKAITPPFFGPRTEGHYWLRQ